MEIKVSIDGDFEQWATLQHAKVERAVTTGIKQATSSLRAAWRADVSSTLGARMANAVRSKVYPEGQPSADAAGVVWAKSPQIINAHENGVTIRSKNGMWLAIPLPAAGGKGRRITPGEWQFKTGRLLRFVSTGHGRGVLLADDVRVGAKGLAVKDRRRIGKSQQRATTAVPIFAMVRQVTLKKRLNLNALAQQVGATLPARIAAALKD